MKRMIFQETKRSFLRKSRFSTMVLLLMIMFCSLPANKAVAGMISNTYEITSFTVLESSSGGLIYMQPHCIFNKSLIPNMTSVYMQFGTYPDETTTDKIISVAIVPANEAIDDCYLHKSWIIEHLFDLPWSNENSCIKNADNHGIAAMDFTKILPNSIFGELSDGSYRFVILAESKTTIQIDDEVYPAFNVLYTTPFDLVGFGSGEIAGIKPFTAELAIGNTNYPAYCHIPYNMEDKFNLLIDGRPTPMSSGVASIGLMEAHLYPSVTNANSSMILANDFYTTGNVGDFFEVNGIVLESSSDGEEILPGPYRFILWDYADNAYYSQVFVLVEPESPKITTESLPPATKNTPYYLQLAAKGTPVITWSVEGYFPDGLHVTDDGLLRGTPTTVGMYSVSILASNSGGSTSKTFLLVVQENIQLQSDPSDTSATISWEPVAGATGYTLTLFADNARKQVVGTYSLDANGELRSSADGKLTYTIPDLLPETTYYYSLTILGPGNAKIGEYTDNFATLLSTSIAGQTLQISPKVYPNPATDYVTVDNLSVDSVITVSDLSGRALYRKNITSERETIDISSWGKGIYIVQAGNKTAKLIKN